MDNPYFTGPTNSFASPEQERMLDAEKDDKVLHDIRDALHIAMNVVRKFQDEGALAQPTVPSNHSEVAQPLDTLVDIVQALDDALMVAANHQDWTREYIDNEAATPRRCPNCGHQIGSDKTLTPSATRNDPAKADGKAGSTIMDDVMDLDDDETDEKEATLSPSLLSLNSSVLLPLSESPCDR